MYIKWVNIAYIGIADSNILSMKYSTIAHRNCLSNVYLQFNCSVEFSFMELVPSFEFGGAGVESKGIR